MSRALYFGPFLVLSINGLQSNLGKKLENYTVATMDVIVRQCRGKHTVIVHVDFGGQSPTTHTKRMELTKKRNDGGRRERTFHPFLLLTTGEAQTNTVDGFTRRFVPPGHIFVTDNLSALID